MTLKTTGMMARMVRMLGMTRTLGGKGVGHFKDHVNDIFDVIAEGHGKPQGPC